MTDLLNIKQWAEEDRPREKLMLKGKSTLSDAELIAILLGSGSKNETAVGLSKRILKRVSDNLIELSKLSIKELMNFKGIGEAKAITIVAALELGKRRRESEIVVKKKISGSKDVFEFFHKDMSDSNYEEFWVLHLNRANKIITKVLISEGGIAGTVADPKRIFKTALDNHSTSIILCHNHPSGNIKPSDADLKLTQKIKEGGAVLDIAVLDHLIIGDEKFFSFADEGLL